MSHRVGLFSLFVALSGAWVGCEEKSACVTQGVVATLSGNHGHSIEIPKGAVERGIGGKYPVRGGDHEHAVSVKDEHFARLKKGESATTRTTSVEGHTHEVTLSCAE